MDEVISEDPTPHTSFSEGIGPTPEEMGITAIHEPLSSASERQSPDEKYALTYFRDLSKGLARNTDHDTAESTTNKAEALTKIEQKLDAVDETLAMMAEIPSDELARIDALSRNVLRQDLYRLATQVMMERSGSRPYSDRLVSPHRNEEHAYGYSQTPINSLVERDQSLINGNEEEIRNVLEAKFGLDEHQASMLMKYALVTPASNYDVKYDIDGNPSYQPAQNIDKAVVDLSLPNPLAKNVPLPRVTSGEVTNHYDGTSIETFQFPEGQQDFQHLSLALAAVKAQETILGYNGAYLQHGQPNMIS